MAGSNSRKGFNSSLAIIVFAAIALVAGLIQSVITPGYVAEFTGQAANASEDASCDTLRERTTTAGEKEDDKWEQRFDNKNCAKKPLDDIKGSSSDFYGSDYEIKEKPREEIRQACKIGSCRKSSVCVAEAVEVGDSCGVGRKCCILEESSSGGNTGGSTDGGSGGSTDGSKSSGGSTGDGTNSAPEINVNINSPKAGVGEPITFDASGSSDSDGSISSYQWDFNNDGSFDNSGARQRIKYKSAGRRQVKLKLTDNDGKTAEKTFEVNIKASAGSLHIVALPYFYSSTTEFKQDVEQGVDLWLQKSPMKELSNPRNNVKISYLSSSEVSSPGTTDLCEMNDDDVARGEVLESKYADSYDLVLAFTNRRASNNIAGCTEGDTAVVYGAEEDSNADTTTHEIGHVFGLGHTMDSDHGSGCGAKRPGSGYINDIASDGKGEIMNYCDPDKYFSTGSDEYSSLKEELKPWMD
jgi:hypothetical protein